MSTLRPVNPGAVVWEAHCSSEHLLYEVTGQILDAAQTCIAVLLERWLLDSAEGQWSGQILVVCLT